MGAAYTPAPWAAEVNRGNSGGAAVLARSCRWIPRDWTASSVQTVLTAGAPAIPLTVPKG
jgi:hypothetical protein